MANNKAEKLIATALSEIGNGPSKYRKWYYGYDAEDVAWCAIFVSWLFQKAGVPMVKTDGAGCFAREGIGKYGTWFESEYSDNNTPHEKGDIVSFVWNYSGRYYEQDKFYSDHVGIVYYVDSQCIYTIEGNSGSSNDTSSVKKRCYSRKDGCINGYFRPKWSDEKDTKGANYMEVKKGDINNFVLAYKSLLISAFNLGLICTQVDATAGFGKGTYDATIEVQKKYNLEIDGIAGKETITTLRNEVNKALQKMKTSVSDRNKILGEAVAAIEKIKN